jgi:hypothetical protein
MSWTLGGRAEGSAASVALARPEAANALLVLGAVGGPQPVCRLGDGGPPPRILNFEVCAVVVDSDALVAQ